MVPPSFFPPKSFLCSFIAWRLVIVSPSRVISPLTVLFVSSKPFCPGGPLFVIDSFPCRLPNPRADPSPPFLCPCNTQRVYLRLVFFSFSDFTYIGRPLFFTPWFLSLDRKPVFSIDYACRFFLYSEQVFPLFEPLSHRLLHWVPFEEKTPVFPPSSPILGAWTFFPNFV